MKQETAISPASELIAYYGGPASDVYFQRAQKTLAGAHVDAVVAMDFFAGRPGIVCGVAEATRLLGGILQPGDRKSTRLNSSHVSISYAVFCLKKKIHVL